MANSGRYVLDSFALIGYLESEPFADTIQKLLFSARRGDCRIFLHAIHLGEVFYIVCRSKGRQGADLAYVRIKRFPLTFVDTIDEKLLLTAAALKADHPISYADAYAAALSEIHHAVLLTGDPEFAILEKKGTIAIQWLHQYAAAGS